MATEKHRYCWRALPAVVLLLVMLALGGSVSASAPMPSFSLPSVTDGSAVSSESFKGKVLLVTFFATWCPPCMEEVPSLIRLQQDYQGQDFSVVALAMDEGGPKVVARLVDKRKINYPVLMADKGVKRDFGGIVGIPTSFLVNRNGVVVKKYPGLVSHAVLERDIATVLR
ncbi:MAG: cytochrome c biogenesis protein (TlpA) [Desulfobulbaceae bacterium A2]|nr:MAG: cytochrome c biogenesis protein (TlpA) [Desulfobulbaceae bacterium A2]